MLINVIVIVLWAFLSRRWLTVTIDRFDYALDQTSKKLSVTLRKEQRDAVQSITAGNDNFVSLPTGGGKSMCFFVLPCLFDPQRNVQGSIVIVISPL